MRPLAGEQEPGLEGQVRLISGRERASGRAGAFLRKGTHVRKKKVIQWARLHSPNARAVVLAPPLIGGDLSQQVRSFRWLARRGFDLFSFDYSGHGGSSGKFSIGASMADTLGAAGRLADACRREDRPLYGVACCYGAVPLLHAAWRLGEPFRKVVLINAIPGFNPSAAVRSFAAYYAGRVKRSAIRPGLKSAVAGYVDFLFPSVAKSRTSFGVLARKRTRLLQTLTDFFILDPLEGIALTGTPVLCIYARRDRVLQMYGSDAGFMTGYEQEIRRICPRTRFFPMDGDHFLSHPRTRSAARSAIASFLSS